MRKRGTPSDVVPGWYVNFQNAVLRNLPRDIGVDVAGDWEGNGESLARVLREALIPPPYTGPFYPKDNEVFELTFDGTIKGNDPNACLRNERYPENFRFVGNRLGGRETKRFMLLCLGQRRNIEAVRSCIASLFLYKVPSGQWIQAFHLTYPKADGEHQVAAADTSWVCDGHLYIPKIHLNGMLCVEGTAPNVAYDSSFRWLVEVK